MTFFLKKLFGARDKINKNRGGQSEMPFLEHLEELRNTLFKIIITLLVFTLGSFVFRKPLMDIIRYPVEMADLGVAEKAPEALTQEDWRDTKRISAVYNRLPLELQQGFLDRVLKGRQILRPYVEAVVVFRGALMLNEKDRPSFVAGMEDEDARAAAVELLKANPKARLDLEGNLINMSALKPAEAFTLSLKLSLIAGIITAFPLLFYFGAQFIFPGLTLREKRVFLPNLAIGFGLFLVGVVFAYFVVAPRALLFFHAFSEDMGVSSDWRIGEYITFVSQMVIIFGIGFELPVVVMTLVKLELLSYEFMKTNRAYAIVIIIAVGAIITPTGDALTLSFLAGPMVLLYEICIWMAWALDRKKRRAEAEEEAARAIRRKQSAYKPPVALPTGTIPAAEDFPIDENDALKENPPEAEEPEYEEGFEPKKTEPEIAPEEIKPADNSPSSVEEEKEDEPIDPYDDYYLHNSFYERSEGETTKPDPKPDNTPPAKHDKEKVDDDDDSQPREEKPTGPDSNPSSGS